MNAAVERLVDLEWFFADAGLAKIVPDKLVRIEFGCIARKKVQLESALLTLHECSNEFGAVRRMAIDNQIGRMSSSLQKCSEEGHKAGGVERPP